MQPTAGIAGKSTDVNAPSAPRKSGTVVIRELCDIFRQGIRLDGATREQLLSQVKAGADYFREWNESRMRLAFESFDSSMKFALFEIIFLLNTNDPKYQNWKYTVFQEDKASAAADAGREFDLFVEGAPCGVKGICSLSTVFRAEFDEYVSETFGDPIALPASEPEPAVEGIFSIGSIGTLGHKNIASDLDLQIQYYLQPYPSDVTAWNDGLLHARLQEELKLHVQLFQAEQGAGPTDPPPEAVRKKLAEAAQQELKKRYPLLFQHFFLKNWKVFDDIIQKNDQNLRRQMVQEILQLMKFYSEMGRNPVIAGKEALLKQRIQKIQAYVNDKFPAAEIYLFSFSRQELQRGYFGSTLDSKESSGGAYELILNYETLLPGIFFTSVIPSHFLFSTEINNTPAQFALFTDIIRFRQLEGLEEAPTEINFQGPTPDLDSLYVARHSAAAYWEAFKGSSGNLPKATLNLLRFEMMLEPKFCKTNIQLVKNPDAINGAIQPTASPLRNLRRTDALYPLCDLFFPPETEEASNDPGASFIFPVAKLLEFEEKFPGLRQDPWWLRYKSLRIGYSSAGLVSGVPEEQLIGISNAIDLSFALHIRVSDIFSRPGHPRVFTRHREKVLVDFLATVFPEGSWQRNRLHSIFIGDVKTVNEFEKELRAIFQNSVERIHFKVSGFELPEDRGTSKEEEIWYHYYKKAFQAAPNVIQKSILSHLQVPRGRLQIGFQKESGWVFRSLQKQSSRGSRFASTILDLLPDEVVLCVQRHFLNGLVYCVINGYYGVFNRGKLNETKTVIEFDRQNLKLATQLDDGRAFVRPDQIERIMKSVLNHFPDRKVSYLDCIREERTVTEMMIFLNLLQYGLLSILYRDNLNTYFVDQIKIPEFTTRANAHVFDYQKMIEDEQLHTVLQQFLMEKKINIYTVSMTAWVNSNSVETTHATTQYEAKERMLSEAFRETILKVP